MVEVYPVSPLLLRLRVRIFGLGEPASGRSALANSSQSMPARGWAPLGMPTDFVRRRLLQPEEAYSHQFVLFAPFNTPLDKVRGLVHQQFQRLYPGEGEIRVLRLRDEQDCDLDDDFLAGQLFNNGSVLLAICQGTESTGRPLDTPVSHTEEPGAKMAIPDASPASVGAAQTTAKAEPITENAPAATGATVLTPLRRARRSKKRAKPASEDAPAPAEAEPPKPTITVEAKPMEKSVERPVEKPVEKPAEKPAAKPPRAKKFKPEPAEQIPEKVNPPATKTNPAPVGPKIVMVDAEIEAIVSGMTSSDGTSTCSSVEPPAQAEASSGSAPVMVADEIHAPRPVQISPFLTRLPSPSEMSAVIQAESTDDSDSDADSDVDMTIPSVPTVRAPSLTGSVIASQPTREAAASSSSSSEAEGEEEEEERLPFSQPPITSLTALRQELKSTSPALLNPPAFEAGKPKRPRQPRRRPAKAKPSDAPK